MLQLLEEKSNTDRPTLVVRKESGTFQIPSKESHYHTMIGGVISGVRQCGEIGGCFELF